MSTQAGGHVTVADGSDTEAAVVAVAAALRRAHKDRTPVSPVAPLLPPGDVTVAYRVQDINSRHWTEEGRRPCGRKIGLTSKVVQAQLGVDQPDLGVLFADMAVADGGCIDAGVLIQPKAEAEVAFVLSRDLPDPQLTTADIIGAIDFAVAAIEVVDSRIEDWRISIVDTVADNASSAMFVLGSQPRKIADLDLRLAGMVMERCGTPVAFGAGAACIGHPLNAVLWLASRMAASGQPLQAGDVVLSGALGPMTPARAGDVFEARINGLGSVSVEFGADDAAS